jgi:sugar lactone lactonase YvrE
MALLLGAVQALGADKRRVKWIRSIYVDAKGVGLKYPEGVACTDRFFVVADTGNSRLLRYSYQDDVVTPEVEFPLAKSSPIKVQLNSAGDVYYLDGRERQIWHVSAKGGEPVRLDPKSLPSSADIVPKSFAIGRDDQIYILDIFSEHVLVLDASGQYQRQVSLPKEFGFIGDVAVDSQGKIYLIDSVSAVVHTAGRGDERFSPLTESLKEYMNFPNKLAIDDNGVIFLVDQHGSGLALVGQDGTFLERKLGMGWKESGLYYPSQICISRSGNVFIADRNNSRIQLFHAGGG